MKSLFSMVSEPLFRGGIMIKLFLYEYLHITMYMMRAISTELQNNIPRFIDDIFVQRASSFNLSDLLSLAFFRTPFIAYATLYMLQIIIFLSIGQIHIQ